MSKAAAVKPLFWLIHVEKVCAEALKVSSLTLNCMFPMRKQSFLKLDIDKQILETAKPQTEVLKTYKIITFRYEIK